MIFEFERDFAGSLRCIPMVVRQKLDIVGIKMTLRQWSRLMVEERAELVTMPCGTSAEQVIYRSRVQILILSRSDEAIRHLDASGLEDWQETTSIPEAVQIQAARDSVSPPTPQQWAALMPLQRFALVKLARSEHENENFVPALREFGVM